MCEKSPVLFVAVAAPVISPQNPYALAKLDFRARAAGFAPWQGTCEVAANVTLTIVLGNNLITFAQPSSPQVYGAAPLTLETSARINADAGTLHISTPIATTTKSMPSRSSMRPKVNRDVSLKRSVPMPAIQRPTSIARSAF